MLVPSGLFLQKGHGVHLEGTQKQSENDLVYLSIDMNALLQSNVLK